MYVYIYYYMYNWISIVSIFGHPPLQPSPGGGWTSAQRSKGESPAMWPRLVVGCCYGKLWDQHESKLDIDHVDVYHNDMIHDGIICVICDVCGIWYAMISPNWGSIKFASNVERTSATFLCFVSRFHTKKWWSHGWDQRPKDWVKILMVREGLLSHRRSPKDPQKYGFNTKS